MLDALSVTCKVRMARLRRMMKVVLW